MNSHLAVGDLIKVMLPIDPPADGCGGETPWAEVVELFGDGSIKARIDNYLVHGADHGFAVHQVVRFVPAPEAPRCPWVPDYSRRN
jgi:hypothetical protein